VKRGARKPGPAGGNSEKTMITREVDDRYWVAAQQDHAAAAGFLAEHWGNETFSAPERFLPSPKHGEQFRTELLRAVAGHEDGWREEETTVETKDASGLPLDFTKISLEESLERWRTCVSYFAEDQPFAALLISLHAYWLLAHSCNPMLESAFQHPVLQPSRRSALPALDAERKAACNFIQERKLEQSHLLERLRRDSVRSNWITPQTLDPTVRLIQVVDSISLRLCFGGNPSATMVDVPRRGWFDRGRVDSSVDGDGRIAVAPYPFDEDPLKVPLKLREINSTGTRGQEEGIAWQEISPEVMTFEFTASARRSGQQRDTDFRNTSFLRGSNH